MKKVAIEDAKKYEAAKHFDMRSIRLQGKDETGVSKFWVGLSHFLPGGGAEMSAGGPTEKVYVCTAGEITVRTEKEEITLKPMDSVFIPVGEAREIINRTNMPASMLVIVNYPS